MLSLKQEIEQGLAAARRAKPARGAGKKTAGGSPAELTRLLEKAGYRLSRTGRRATCPKCTNGRRDDLTVSVSLEKGLYCCHRCSKGGAIRKLGRANPYVLATRTGKAAIRKREFQQWLDGQMRVLGDRERRFARRAGYAAQALQVGVGWPTDALAWLVLADFYHAQRNFEEFWQDASHKCGRLELYRRWRRGTRG